MCVWSEEVYSVALCSYIYFNVPTTEVNIFAFSGTNKMIKEKHDKGPDTSSTVIKDEPAASDNILNKSIGEETRIKSEDDNASSSCAGSGGLSKNGPPSVIGSTNTGSLGTERKEPPPLLLEGGTEDSGPQETSTTTLMSSLKTEEGLDKLPGQEPYSQQQQQPAPPPPPDGVQPLASNIVSKQSGSVEVQYMQQQSQIFVFSTQLANKGADAVFQGHYPSIIAYHCAQPGTKKYLEKNPLKITQFNRQNPAQWLNNLAMMKNKGCTRSPNVGKGTPNMDGFLVSDSLDDMVNLPDSVDLPWDQKANMVNIEGMNNGVLPGEVESSCQMRSSPGGGMSLVHSPVMGGGSAGSPSLASMQPSLQGVKVPDENLTPQQRQHREEQLATIRKMQQMLFPEHQGMPTAGEGQLHHSDCQDGGLGPGPGPMDMPHRPHMNMPLSAQMEWHKLQHQFMEERNKGGRGQTNMVPCHNSPAVVSRVGAGSRLQGPPPPYHQTPRSASVPIALQSPSPASPNNPTSNLSLPSPRASSALNSPADPGRSFSLGRHVSTGQSPTSQDSPSAGRGLVPSNPGTPISSHLSPVATTAQDYPPTSAADGMFGRTLQSLAQQKQNLSTSVSSANANKEPNLMPVPSPQQIQYLNTFEGQELTIQKQPNTSLKDGSIISPTLISTTIESGFAGVTTDSNKLSGRNTPLTPSSLDMAPRFSSGSSVNTDGCRFQMSSPQAVSTNAPTPNNDKTSRTVANSCLSPQGSRTPSCSGDMHKPEMAVSFASSPHAMMDVHRFSGQSSCPSSTSPGPFSNQQQQAGKMGGFIGGKMELPGGVGGAPPVSYGCSVRSDNVPLNPNSTSSMSGNPKVSHFDPISSLAQMSQQLTNSVASNLNGQNQNQSTGMMNFPPAMHMGNVMDMACHMPDMDNSPGPCNMMMPMHGPGPHAHQHPHQHQYHPGNNSPMGGVRSLSPKMGGGGTVQGVFPPPGSMSIPRMMGRLPGCNPYNGANIQVKPGAPNTIQYMPAKPQMSNHGQPPPPRAPPSLDFLQRFANPMMGGMDGKMVAAAAAAQQQQQGMQYFGGPPNNGHMGGPPQQQQNDGGDGGPMQHVMNGGVMGGPQGMMGGPQGPMGMNLPMMRGMRPPGMGMMPVRMPQMGGYNGPANGGPVDGPMFPPNQGQMFVSGPKSSPMGGMGQPDASQPLPPSIGQSATFKNSPFVGPTTADPNYAQQFHNFQQQLYATSTRSQAMGPGPPPPLQPQQPYFVPK